MERWEGDYTGQWEAPLGGFTLRVKRSAAIQPQVRTRHDFVAGNPGGATDSDGDGVADGSVELRLQLDLLMSSADGSLQIATTSLEAVARSANQHVVGYHFEYAELDVALEDRLASDMGVTAACSAGVLGIQWPSTGDDRVTLVVGTSDDRPQNCRIFQSTDVAKSPLP